MFAIRQFIILLTLVATAAAANPLSVENIGNPVFFPQAATYSPDGRYFVMAGMTTMLYDARTRKPLKLLGLNSDEAVALAYSKDGKMLAVEYLFFSPPAKDNNDLAHEIVVYSMPDGKELHRFRGLDSGYNWRRRLRFSPDGKRIATSNSKKIAVYDIKTGKITWEWLYDHKVYPTWSYAAFDCTQDWNYFMFNLIRISYPDKKLADKTKWSDEKRPFFWGNIISPDGKRALAYGGGNGVTKKLFELETGKLLALLDKHSTENAIANKDFTTFYFNKCIWTPSKKEIVEIDGSNQQLRAVSSSGVLTLGHYLVTPKDIKEKKTIIFCDKWQGCGLRGFSLTGFTPEGWLILDPSYSRRQNAMDLKTGVVKELKKGPTGDRSRPKGFDYSARAFSPNKKVGMTDGGKLVYPKDTKKESTSIFPKDSKRIWGAPFFLDNNRVVLRTGSKYHLHDMTTGKTQAVDAPKQRSGNMKMALSADSKWLVSTDGDWRTFEKQLICVHSASDLKCASQFELSPKGGYTFSPDNKWFATFSGRSAKLYKAGEWKLVREFGAPFGRITEAALSAGGKTIIIQINHKPCIIFAADGSITGYLIEKEKLLDAKGKPMGK